MKELREVCKVIYGVILTVITRRRFLKTKQQIVQVQKMIKVGCWLQVSSRSLLDKNISCVLFSLDENLNLC